MSNLTFASFCPHPPIIVPSIGKQADLKKVSKTIEAMDDLSRGFEKAEVDSVVIVSPHSPISSGRFGINISPTLVGHFYNFGDFDTELKFKNNLKLANLIRDECNENDIPLSEFDSRELDHGVLVPIYYLAQGKSDIKIVNISYSDLRLKEHYEFGELIHNAINNYQGKVGFVASGDLSHRLIPEAPAGYAPEGKKFDQRLTNLIKNNNEKEIMEIDPELREKAGECGYRSLIILLGVLSNLNWDSEILSYEGPFGVGYLVASFKLTSYNRTST